LFINFQVIIDKRTGRYASCRYASCPLDLCRIIGLRPQFSALWASSRSAASIHSAACSVLRCSVTASYKDVDDASPWWRRLCDVTAHHSPNWHNYPSFKYIHSDWRRDCY